MPKVNTKGTAGMGKEKPKAGTMASSPKHPNPPTKSSNAGVKFAGSK